MERQAWFCPACQRHHAPHVDPCPAPTLTMPGSLPFQPATPQWVPAPQIWPSLTGGSVTCEPDPNLTVVN